MNYAERAVRDIKAGRVKSGGVTISAHISSSQGETIRRICGKYKINISEFIRNAIDLELLKWRDG